MAVVAAIEGAAERPRCSWGVKWATRVWWGPSVASVCGGGGVPATLGARQSSLAAWSSWTLLRERVSRCGHAGRGGHLFEDKGENCSVFS